VVPIDVTATGVTVNTASAPVVFENGSGGTVASTGNAITVKSNTTITVTGASDPISVTGTGNQATVSSDTINVATGAEIWIAGSNDTVVTNANATVYIYGNNDIVNAGAGSTVNATGGVINTIIVGWWPTIYGYIPIYGTQDLSNQVNLNSGNVKVGAGSTVKITGSNDNITIAGSSTATVTGNSENFVFHPSFGKDVVNGFNGTDTLQFDHAIFADWAHLLGAAHQSGADTIITVDAADTITLKNFAVSSLTQNQASFV
jgi:trimeric autotransporter adhesin